MKSKEYKHGSTRFRLYQKPVGQGYEIGLVCGGKPLFVGNFIKSQEANQFFQKSNRKIRNFAKKVKIPQKTPPNWYRKMLADTICAEYYGYLNRVIPMHGRRAKTSLNKDQRQWRRMKRHNGLNGRKLLHLRAA